MSVGRAHFVPDEAVAAAVVAVAGLLCGAAGCVESPGVALDVADGAAADTAPADTSPADTGREAADGSADTGGETGVDTASGATCDDGVENGQETAVDCGGPECPPCPEYAWETGEWSDCDPDTCKQTREVTCVRDGQFEAVDARCSGEKPESERRCEMADEVCK